jgi:hypothetical protein
MHGENLLAFSGVTCLARSSRKQSDVFSPNGIQKLINMSIFSCASSTQGDLSVIDFVWLHSHVWFYLARYHIFFTKLLAIIFLCCPASWLHVHLYRALDRTHESRLIKINIFGIVLCISANLILHHCKNYNRTVSIKENLCYGFVL